MCAYPRSYHALPNWKCVLWCCADFLCINISDQETDNQYSYTTPSIRFHIYHIISRCTYHGRIPLEEKQICYICEQESSSDGSTKIYTRKELVMMKIKILIFIPVYIYLPSKSWPFANHMCAYLVQITVVKCDAQTSNNMNYLKMFYVVVIMLRGWL